MESAAPKSARASIESAMAILIVKGAFLGITEDFVSFPDLFELFLRRFIPGIFIRVIFYGELSVGLFYFLFGGRSLHCENLVIIAFGHGQAAGFLATTTVAGRSRRSRNL